MHYIADDKMLEEKIHHGYEEGNYFLDVENITHLRTLIQHYMLMYLKKSVFDDLDECIFLLDNHFYHIHLKHSYHFTTYGSFNFLKIKTTFE